MTTVLGVDGGGTKTHAVVADESGRVLGLSIRGPSNWEEVGLPRAADALERAVTTALGEGYVDAADLAASVFGLAGVDWKSDELRIETVLRPLRLSGSVEIVNDAQVALRAGTSKPEGVVVIAGTGSVVAGRNSDGQTFRTLGLGPYFGDYVVANGGGGEMMLSVKDDGFVTLTPADPYAAATGTIDEAGNVDVTTKFDTVAQSVLHFTGVVKFDGVSWRASGKVVAQYSPNQPGTWAAVRK